MIIDIECKIGLIDYTARVKIHNLIKDEFGVWSYNGFDLLECRKYKPDDYDGIDCLDENKNRSIWQTIVDHEIEKQIEQVENDDLL
jgi:hypothetical protein